VIIIGCDPGLTGAICAIDTQRGLLDCLDLPTCGNGQESGSMKRWLDAGALQELLADWSARFNFAGESVHAAIERPIPMPSLPAQTIASQFDTFGVIRTVLERHAQHVHFPNPRVWKKLFGLGPDKNAGRECCLRLYPESSVKRVKDHNRAEAILIGHWLRLEVA
jgi:hypothetical protein